MEDLDGEIVATRHAYIATAITEIAALRARRRALRDGTPFHAERASRAR
jgi:hypothetical protein